MPAKTPPKDAGKDDTKAAATPIIPKDSTTQGSVSIAGHTINYQAVAGTILVAASNDADAALGMTAQPAKETPDAPPTARMFYVAYFKKDVPAGIAPGDLHLQRRPRQFHHVAAHGRLRSQARDYRRRPAHQPRAL